MYMKYMFVTNFTATFLANEITFTSSPRTDTFPLNQSELVARAETFEKGN